MARRNSVGIIGMGWVGTSVAISTLHAGVCSELILADVREGLAEGEAMDLSHGSSFYPSATVRSGTVQDMIDCSAVVIAAGKGGKPGQSRLDLLRDNLNVSRQIAQQLKGFRGVVVLVTNPVDVLTYDFTKASGLPAERVIGTGTMLDTARLRQILGKTLSVDPRSLHAQVIGEHGDSEVFLWSTATLGGTRIRRRKDWSSDHEQRISNEVRTAAYNIIQRKGATNHAIGLVTAALLGWMLRGERRVVNVSRVQCGTFGLQDVALSLPTIVGADGATEILEPDLDDTERAGLEHSAEVLRQALKSAEA